MGKGKKGRTQELQGWISVKQREKVRSLTLDALVAWCIHFSIFSLKIYPYSDRIVLLVLLMELG